MYDKKSIIIFSLISFTVGVVLTGLFFFITDYNESPSEVITPDYSGQNQEVEPTLIDPTKFEEGMVNTIEIKGDCKFENLDSDDPCRLENSYGSVLLEIPRCEQGDSVSYTDNLCSHVYSEVAIRDKTDQGNYLIISGSEGGDEWFYMYDVNAISGEYEVIESISFTHVAIQIESEDCKESPCSMAFTDGNNEFCYVYDWNSVEDFNSQCKKAPDTRNNNVSDEAIQEALNDYYYTRDYLKQIKDEYSVS